MTIPKTTPSGSSGEIAAPCTQSPAAKRALAEAAERRAVAEKAARDAGETLPKEINGRDGLDPARYGDWETKGIASDF